MLLKGMLWEFQMTVSAHTGYTHGDLLYGHDMVIPTQVKANWNTIINKHMIDIRKTAE